MWWFCNFFFFFFFFFFGCVCVCPCVCLEAIKRRLDTHMRFISFLASILFVVLWKLCEVNMHAAGSCVK